jgi:cyclopropane fatty-acyl-phospholipid synthase-like methyltransferase
VKVHYFKLLAKRVFFPGLDLHTRCRYRFLPGLLGAGRLETLDAGSGNGALSYAAYKRGSRVLGISIDERSVRDTAKMFEAMGISSSKVEFRQMNIYDLRKLSRKFDQIICSETLEHIRRDQDVILMFSDLLNPGGRLVLCCPHAIHPQHALGRTDEPETGYHVRDGYTLQSYRQLLDPAGFKITYVVGLGSPLLCNLDNFLRRLRHKVGDVGAFPVFALLMPLTWLDYRDPKMPFSLAVVAEKVRCASA